MRDNWSWEMSLLLAIVLVAVLIAIVTAACGKRLESVMQLSGHHYRAPLEALSPIL